MKRVKMKLLAATVMSLFLLAWASAQANQAGAASGSGAPPVASSEDSQTINITRSGSQPSRQGPAENFTGSVRIDPLFQANAPSRTSGARVTFEPGARTAWHTHPLGQILIVTAGTGWVQQWGGQIQEIRRGDVVWIPPGLKHWHRATAVRDATSGGVHVSIEALGRAFTVLQSIHPLRKRGRHVQAGLTSQEERGLVALPIDLIVTGEWEIVGSKGNPHPNYAELLALVARQKLRPARLVTRQIALEDVTDTLERMTRFDTVGFEVITRFA